MKSSPASSPCSHRLIAQFLTQLLERITGEYTEESKLHITRLLSYLPDSLEQTLSATLKLIDQHGWIYESELQKVELKVRKHVKVEIELKLYYEHLEQRLQDEAKKYAELEAKYVKIRGSSTSSMQNSLNMRENGGEGLQNRRESLGKIKSRLVFHQLADFTRKVDIRPFEKTLNRKSRDRDPHSNPNSLSKIRRSNPSNPRTRKSDAQILKQIASGRVINNSSRASLNRRSISNSNLRNNESHHKQSKPSLK